MNGRSSVIHTSPNQEEIFITLLGPPRIETGDAVLSIPRRQARALLYHLAAGLQMFPREHLCFLFWPDTTETAARRNFSRLLTHLRRALPAPDLLFTCDERVGLDPQRVFTDVDSFHQLSLCKDQTQFLQQAADLYRGPFLSGFSLPGSPEFEAWLRQQQRAYEQHYLDLLALLVDRYTACKNYEAAIGAAKKFLAVDDLAEDIHRQLISLYACTGNRSAALRQFERCAAVLERELGVSPLPETRVAYQRAQQSHNLPQELPSPKIRWTTLSSLDAPLVGREELEGRLSEVLLDVEGGRGRVVLISGEPGIGKSRLMEVFATNSKGRALVLAGAARASEQPLPYQPLAEAFRTVPDWRLFTSGVKTIWLAEAARLLPELHELQPNLPPPLPDEPTEARTRLIEALCRMTLALADGSRPLVLCLDDLQWADTATLDWLAHLSPRIVRERILILGTYRTDDSGMIDSLRYNLLRLGILTELSLRSLSAENVHKIVRHVIDSQINSTVFSDRLHQVTGGNPFFLLETLRALVEVGQLTDDPDAFDDIPLPKSVWHAVEARLTRLDPRSLQVLEAGALLGRSFDFELIRCVAGRGEIEVVESLEEAVARQLIELHASGYRFRHALIRQIVEMRISALRRHLLHRRAAQALSQLDPQAALKIARHFDYCGDGKNAIRYYAEAVKQAQDLFAWKEAEDVQDRMLVLLDQIDPDRLNVDDFRLRAQILIDRAHIRFLQGRLKERDDDLDALDSLAEECGDQEMRLQALVQHVRYLNLDARYESAIQVAEEGLTLAGVLGCDNTVCRLLAQIGFAHYFLGQPQQALKALKSALESIDENGSVEMRGRITHVLAYVHFHLGDYRRSLDFQEEAYTCHQAVGDQNRMAWDGLDIGSSYLEMGDLVKARRVLDEHLALARRIGARPAEAHGLTLLGSWELYQGTYAAAIEHFQAARSMQKSLRSEHGMVAAELGAALSLYHLGEYARGKDLVKRGIRRARAIGHRRRLAESLIALGLLELESGCPEAAMIGLQEAVKIAREAQCWKSFAAGLTALARVERRKGNLPGSLDYAREGLHAVQEHGLLALEVWTRMELALSCLANGDKIVALEESSQAVNLLPHFHEAWIGREDVHHANAKALKATGHDEEALEQIHLAGEVLRNKAEGIPDSERRQQYLHFAHTRTW